MKFLSCKGKLLLLFVLFISATIENRSLLGQNTLNYSIGFVSNIGSASNSLPVFSYPLLFSQNQNCINLNSGLSKYLKSSPDIFSFSCTIDKVLNSLSFNVYPNPSTGNTITIKLTEKYFGIQDTLVVKIMGYNGVSYASYSFSLAQLMTGMKLSLPFLSAGIYVINIISEQNKISANQKLIIVK